MEKRIVLCIASLALFVVSVNSVEGSWLSGIPKADRAKLSSTFSSLKNIGDNIRVAHANAVLHEAQYARKARSLARLLDLSASSETLPALSDQRLLRWESARDLAEGRYGRAAKTGFESLSVLEARMRTEGAGFSAALSKSIPKLKREALASLIADLENRTASHPDCPPKAFSALRVAATSLSVKDKGRWALSLSTGLPQNVVTFFTDRLKESGEDRFAASLMLFKRALDTAASIKRILPAAAAAAWYVDSVYSRLPAPAAASLSSFVGVLLDSNPEAVVSVLAEFPDLDLAFSEWSALIWVAFQKNPASFQADFGLSPDSVKHALKKAWEIKGPSGTVSPEHEVLTPHAVRAAERMAVFAEGAVSDALLLGAFSTLRTDYDVLRAFRLGSRYEAARVRVATAFAAVLSSVEKSDLNPSLRSLRVQLDSDAYTDDAIVISYATLEGAPIRLDLFAPALAPALAKSLGRISESKKKEEAVFWLEERGIFFSLPCFARGIPPTAEELEILSDAGGFYPISKADGKADGRADGRADDRADISAATRNGFLRNLIAVDASRFGIPLRFVDSHLDVARKYAAMYSCAARYVELSRSKAGQ